MQAMKNLLIILAVVSVTSAYLWKIVSSDDAATIATTFATKLESTVKGGKPDQIKQLFSFDFKANGCGGVELNVDKAVALFVSIGNNLSLTVTSAKYKDSGKNTIEFTTDADGLGKSEVTIGKFGGEWKLVAARDPACVSH